MKPFYIIVLMMYYIGFHAEAELLYQWQLVHEARRELAKLGLMDVTSERGWHVTDKGVAYAERLAVQPLPVQ
ncbi:MAG: hypothetical protein MN733_18175 [Nitrososphaera sp.]|nr:hypothetical protein [Nitrososphaera sp.]